MARRAMAIVYEPAAAAVVREQIAWYDARSPGLGQQFLARLLAAEQLILSYPEGFAQLPEVPGVRAAVVRQFPFRLPYALRGDAVLILAVAHTSRKPPFPSAGRPRRRRLL